LPHFAEWGFDPTPNVARPVAIAFFSTAAVKDFASFLIEAEAKADRNAIEAELADEERILAAAGGRSTVDAK
jgi:hypothetical protein